MAKHGKAGLAPSGALMGAGPEAELRRGAVAFDQGDYAQAIQAWRQALRAGATAASPLAEAHFRRALAATSEGRRAQELQEAIELAPERAVYHFHLGLASLRQGQRRRALAAFEAAHRLAPGDGRFRHHLALALVADPAAASRVQELLAGAPAEEEAAARLRALAWLRQNEPARAVAALAALKSPSPLAALALGLAQRAAGQSSEAALETLARVRRSRRPLSPEARQAAAIATAVAQLEAGDPARALDTLQALEIPTDATLRDAFAAACRRLAQELVLEECPEQAVLACGQALAAAPDHTPTRALLGHLHELLGTRAAGRGDLARAARHWEAALAEQPGSSQLLRNLALAEERLERWEQASARWEELAHLWKKELRAARQRDEEASAELRQRLAVTYRHLAAAYEAADDVHAAARTLESALNFDPSQVELRLRAAELYLENEEYAKAIDHLRRSLAARPDDTRLLLDLGSAYDLKGDDRQAQGYLEQALTLEPGSRAVKATLASVHHGRGHRLLDARQPERAVAEFERAVELDPGAPEHYECLGEPHLRLGQLDAARAAFARALTLSPGDPRARVTIGGVYLAHGLTQDAEKLFRQALRLHRGPATHLAIGLAYLRAGNTEKMHQHLQPLLKGRDPLGPALLGKLLIEAKREEEAIPYLERAVALDPLNVRARLDLAWAVTFGRHDYARATAELAAARPVAKAAGDQQRLAEIDDADRVVEALKMETLPAARGSRSRGEPWR